MKYVLGDLIRDYIENLESVKAYSNETSRAYMSDLTEFSEFICTKIFKGNDSVDAGLSRITHLIIRQYLGVLYKKNMRKSTMARKLSAIRSFFNYLVKHEIISENPADLVSTPKQEKHIPFFLTVDEMFRILNSVDTETLQGQRNRAIAEVLYSTGIRVSELTGLNVADVDYGEKLVRVFGKGKKERIVPIGDIALSHVKEYRDRVDTELFMRGKKTDNKQSKALFLNKYKGRLTTRSIARILDKVALECSMKVPVSPHAFRHSFATHILDSGADLRGVQEMLGHKSLSTTQKYTHVSIDKLMETYDKAHPRGRKK